MSKKSKEKTLRLNLQKLIGLESRAPGVFKDDIQQIKQKLEMLDADRYRGALVRARTERLAAGETPTKRILGIEKAQSRRNQIIEIEWKGRLSAEKEDVERAFFEYYQTLFDARAVDLENFQRAFLGAMPRLHDEDKERLELPITGDEVECAILKLNPGKAPGPDGLSSAFYKKFKHILSPLLAAVYNEAFDLKALPPSFAEAHTILIPKTDNREKLKQVTAYRPISLTNVDYKILMKVIAQRLQTVITELVGPHQTCGIKGRSIFTNIHKARCVLECCDAMNACVAVLQLDLEKAFDCVSHEILLGILDYVNVGAVIRDSVAMAYQNCTTRLIVNKNLGAPVKVRRSVRQGCPLSPLLFCIYIEALCLRIIQCEGVKGFQMCGSEVKLLAYADDVAVFCADIESVERAVGEVKVFSAATGSHVNWGKCLGFWHGNWPSTPSTLANVSWVTTPVQYLGAPLDSYKNSEQYWQAQTQETRRKTEKWKGVSLSMFARATVCNLFLVSKIWFVMQVLHCSRVNVQKIHRVFAVFIWGSTWERCARDNLFRRVRDGGLGLTHLFVRQLVNRFLFLRDTSDPFLRAACQLRLARALPELIVSTESMSCGVHGFFKEIVSAVRFLLARFSIEYLSSVSRKKLYKDIRDSVFPVPLYRSIYRDGPGQDVLKRVKRMPVKPGVKTFFFKLHTGTLSVRTYLEERGMFVPWGTMCYTCKLPETVEHVFLHCWEGVYFWDVLQRTIRKDLPLDPHGIRFLATESDDGVPFDLIMLIGLHSLWLSRTARLHNDEDARPARLYFRESISAYVEGVKSQGSVPEWLPRIEPLATLREF